MNYLEKDVMQAALERIEYIFDEFDNVYVSFSGGKDSSVLLNLALKVAKERSRRIGVFHMDYEAQYQATTAYVDSTLSAIEKDCDIYRCCVPVKVPTCTSMHQDHWRPWEESKRSAWVRNMPENCLRTEDFDFLESETTDYDFQARFGDWIHKKKRAKRTCALVGIRTQESLNRWRTIASKRKVNRYKGKPWTTCISANVTNAYPIYDWVTEDVWTAHGRYGWDYNELYDLFYSAGVRLHDMRVASPFLSQAISSLHLYKRIDFQVWDKMVERVNGVNFSAIYGDTCAMGKKKLEKPKSFSTWADYAAFLIQTLPHETATKYKKKAMKIKQNSDDLVWEKLCIAIFKNDFAVRSLSITQLKKRTERRNARKEMYKNL